MQNFASMTPKVSKRPISKYGETLKNINLGPNLKSSIKFSDVRDFFLFLGFLLP